MGDAPPSDFSAACFRVQRKFAHWRQRHRPRTPLPEELWREAGELACAHGINRTARALRLDYYSLQKRAAAAARLGVRPSAARSGTRAPEFVELLPGGIPASPFSRPECLIEVEDPGGAKLRIHLQGGEFPDVAALTRGFREGGS
jgi:hypothetical protein